MGTLLPPKKKGADPHFRPMSVVTKRLDGLRCHLVHGGRPRPRQHSVRWRPSSPPQGHSSPPLLGPCLLWPNGWMHQDIPLGMEVGLRPGHVVLDGDRPSPAFPKRRHSSPHFRPISIVNKRLEGSKHHLVWRKIELPPPAPHTKRRHIAGPHFSAHVYCCQTVDHLSHC